MGCSWIWEGSCCSWEKIFVAVITYRIVFIESYLTALTPEKRAKEAAKAGSSAPYRGAAITR